ncbi:hypothetical protein GOP47_0016291 [Adiantum capillus-veneris]|uniref:Secreted protein n=1 Tax=Adiantum capillus-veneris TaxID=13818 RepID=A0A9D4ZCU0_ADICA|nr:hypothetical protein GOP47_0016291 [Adiantum capillus-veneris]
MNALALSFSSSLLIICSSSVFSSDHPSPKFSSIGSLPFALTSSYSHLLSLSGPCSSSALPIISEVCVIGACDRTHSSNASPSPSPLCFPLTSLSSQSTPDCTSLSTAPLQQFGSS